MVGGSRIQMMGGVKMSEAPKKERDWPLHAAVLRSDTAGITALLASRHPHLDAADDQGMTPLLWAVFRGDRECVEKLLISGADPNGRGIGNERPLWHAEEDFGLAEVAAILKRHGATK